MGNIPGTSIPTEDAKFITRAELEEMVAKADLTTATGLAAAHILTNKQRDEFISYGQDWAVLLMDATRQDMTNPTEDINQISMVDGVAHVIGAAGETTPVTAAERAVPSFTRAQLCWEEFLLQIRITKRWLKSNIAKGAGRAQVHAECAKAVWWGLENAAWFGDTTAANPAGWGNRLGTTINGWRRQAVTNQYDHGGAIPNALLFHNMILTLPTRYRTQGWPARYRFYMHPDIIERFVYAIQQRATPLGDNWMVKDGDVYYRGVKFVGAACFQTNITGTGTASSYSTTTDILLSEPKNLVFGLGQDVEIFTHPEPDGRFVYSTYSAYIDVAFALEAKVVRAINVRNAVV